MFKEYSMLNSLRYILNLNIANIYENNKMFNGCTSLKALPDIFKYDTTNIKDNFCQALKSFS